MGLRGLLHNAKRSMLDSKESKFHEEANRHKVAFRAFARRFSLDYDSEYAHYFSVLGIKPTGNRAAIRKAYRAIIKAYHPDVNKSLLSEEITREANEAYRFLSNYSMRSEGESLPKGSKSLILDQLYSEYERLLEADYDKLKGSLGSGSVERWYYDQEMGRFLDWKKRSAIAANNVLGDFMSLGKHINASVKAGRKLIKNEADERKKLVLRDSTDEAEYLYGRYVHFKRLIEMEVLKSFYASARRNSEEVRKRMTK